LHPELSNCDSDGIESTTGDDGVSTGGRNKTVNSRGKPKSGRSNKPRNGSTGNAGTSVEQEGTSNSDDADGRDTATIEGDRGANDGGSRRGYEGGISAENVLQFLNRSDELVRDKVNVHLNQEKTTYPADLMDDFSNKITTKSVVIEDYLGETIKSRKSIKEKTQLEWML